MLLLHEPMKDRQIAGYLPLVNFKSLGRLKVLARQKVELALLDVKLGAETVFPISKLLDGLHIPYIFITGESGAIPDEYRHRPAIVKPYEAKTLVWQIKQLLTDAQSRGGQARGMTQT